MGRTANIFRHGPETTINFWHWPQALRIAGPLLRASYPGNSGGNVGAHRRHILRMLPLFSKCHAISGRCFSQIVDNLQQPAVFGDTLSSCGRLAQVCVGSVPAVRFDYSDHRQHADCKPQESEQDKSRPIGWAGFVTKRASRASGRRCFRQRALRGSFR